MSNSVDPGAGRFARFVSGAFVLAICWATSTGQSAEPAEPKVVSRQTREFRVLVDRRERGSQTMVISRRSDGSEMMRAEAEVSLNLVVYRYRYASTGTEVWKGGRLIELASEADYNGDKYVVQASASNQALHYEVNGEAQKAPPDIWAASYWREPPANRVNQKVKLLDADKGRQLTAILERVGQETLTIDETPIKATRYRLRGDVEVDVWYDASGIIVRQESMESGHRTVLEVVKVKQDPLE